MRVPAVTPGTSAPPGATVHSGGVDFSVFAKHATSLELLLFDDGNATGPGAPRPGSNAATAMTSMVAAPASYDWEGDAPLNRPMTATIIDELHVRGFTRHASSGVAPARRGPTPG